MMRPQQRVRLLLVLLPAVLVGVFEFVRHDLFMGLPLWTGNVLSAGVATVGSLLYYQFTFSVVQRLSAKVQEQKAREAAFEERERIADDLHDSVSQALFFLNVRMNQLKKHLGTDPTAQEMVADIQSDIQSVHQDVRRTIYSLKTTPDEPLISVLRGSLTKLERQAGIGTELHWNASVSLPPLSEDAKKSITTFVQEGLNNIRKHAKAQHVDLFVESGQSSVTFRLKDDGTGFDTHRCHAGYGLDSIARRAKRLNHHFRVQSNPQEGTTLTLEITLPGSKRKRDRQSSYQGAYE